MLKKEGLATKLMCSSRGSTNNGASSETLKIYAVYSPRCVTAKFSIGFFHEVKIGSSGVPG